MPRNRVPILVKHCAVAIFTEEKKLKGSTKEERFEAALTIARARLMEYGFLAKGADKGDANEIVLTAKGRKQEAVHARERGGSKKNTLFDKLYRLVENKKLEEMKQGRDNDKAQDTK